MNTKEFFAALELLEKEKGISKDIIIEAFEHALLVLIRKISIKQQMLKLKLMNIQEQ